MGGGRAYTARAVQPLSWLHGAHDRCGHPFRLLRHDVEPLQRGGDGSRQRGLRPCAGKHDRDGHHDDRSSRATQHAADSGTLSCRRCEWLTILRWTANPVQGDKPAANRPPRIDVSGIATTADDMLEVNVIIDDPDGEPVVGVLKVGDAVGVMDRAGSFSARFDTSTWPAGTVTSAPCSATHGHRFLSRSPHDRRQSTDPPRRTCERSRLTCFVRVPRCSRWSRDVAASEPHPSGGPFASDAGPRRSSRGLHAGALVGDRSSLASI